jgi:hypothetical protein
MQAQSHEGGQQVVCMIKIEKRLWHMLPSSIRRQLTESRVYRHVVTRLVVPTRGERTKKKKPP